MNPEVKEQWLAALRSGEYSQGIGVLRRADDTYCCLGVLTDLAVKAGVVPEWQQLEFGRQEYYIPHETARDIDNALPPHKVREWAGLESQNPHVKVDGKSRTLAGCNDDGDHDFNQIADLIEEQL